MTKTYEYYNTTKNHEENVIPQVELVESKLKEFGLTEISEMTSMLKEVSKTNNYIKALLNNKSWHKWTKDQIEYITPKIFKEEKLVTKYLLEGHIGPLEVFKGDVYGDPLLHINYFKGKDYLELELSEVRQKDSSTRTVLYKYKYLRIDRLKLKIKSGEELTNEEIKFLFDSSIEISRIKTKDNVIESLVDLDGEQYIIRDVQKEA